jgi:hypothetical protein
MLIGNDWCSRGQPFARHHTITGVCTVGPCGGGRRLGRGAAVCRGAAAQASPLPHHGSADASVHASVRAAVTAAVDLSVDASIAPLVDVTVG